MNKRRIIYRKIFFALTMALVFTLPLYKKAAPFFIALMLVNWFAEGHFRSKFSALFAENLTYPVLFFASIVFYLMHVIWHFLSSGVLTSFSEIELKLSFLIFPIIVLPIYSFRFKRSSGKWLLLSYVSGAFVGSVYCTVQAFISYLNTGDLSMLYYGNFSVLVHPTYYGMYMILAIILLTEFLYKRWKSIKNIYKIGFLALILWFATMTMLSNSRAAILAMGLVFLFMVLYLSFKTRKYLLGATIIALLIIAGFSVQKFTPHVLDRFHEGIGEAIKMRSMDNIKNWDGTTTRVQVYYSAIELIEENFWFGVGSSNVTDRLMDKYIKYNFRHPIWYKYNAHNQYLQVFVGLGLVGFTVFMIIFLVLFFYAIRQGNMVQIAFILMLFILFMFESMLQQQAGIVFIVFSILFFHAKDRILSLDEYA